MKARFMDIELTEREIAALFALDTLVNPATGGKLRSTMQAAGHVTSTGAAHAAGARLYAKGLVSKGTLDGFGDLMRYEITKQGREWIEQYRRMGGRP